MTFPAGSHWIALDLPMRDNEYHEPDGEVRVEVLPGDGYQVRPGGGSDWTDILEDPRDHGEYELSVLADGGPVHEGRPAAFEVCRQSYFGSSALEYVEPLEARVEVSETGGDRVAARHEGRRTVTIGANRRCAGVSVPTRHDPSAAADTGTVTVGILYGVNYFPNEERQAASVAVLHLSMEQTTGDGPEPPRVTLTASAETATEGTALEYALSRTGPVEEELAVDLDVSETGAMLAAYPSRGLIPSGQATGAFTILTLDDGTDEADSVVTVEIAADGESYTLGDPASAAVTVTDDDEAALPLTSSFDNVPASHDGESVFTFELRFSEEFPIGYKNLQNHDLFVKTPRQPGARWG